MGLMQFLAVGRSVDRIRDHPTRYKMTQQNFLPKFGATNSDDRQVQTKRVAAPGEPRAARKARAPKRAFPAAKATVQSLKHRFIKRVRKTLKFRNPMQSITLKVNPASMSADAAVKQPFPRGRWTVLSKTSFFTNPFVFTRKSNAERLPLQTELALDAVKPVRNDLRDIDFETNPASDQVTISTDSSCADLNTAEAATDAKTQSPPPAWERVTAQLFGAGKA